MLAKYPDLSVMKNEKVITIYYKIQSKLTGHEMKADYMTVKDYIEVKYIYFLIYYNIILGKKLQTCFGQKYRYYRLWTFIGPK